MSWTGEGDGGESWQFITGATGRPGIKEMMPGMPDSLKFPDPKSK